jgi:hypothetical protein
MMEEFVMATRQHGCFFPVVEMLRIHKGFVRERSVVKVWDSRDVEIEKITDLEKQKGTFSTKIKANALKKIQCSSLDGKAKFIYCLTDTLSPSNTDAKIMKYILDLETAEGVTGGLKEMLAAIPGFFTLHMFDKETRLKEHS